MDRAAAPIKLGTPVRFRDRWRGTVSGFDVSEDWEVLNLHVTSGMMFLRRAVKLPFSVATRWHEDGVDIDASSFEAFNREVLPVAAPARLISAATQVSHPGARVGGLIIQRADRRTAEVLIATGLSRLYRISAAHVQFERNTMALGEHFEGLVEFRSDPDLEQRVHDAIAQDEWLTADDKRSLVVRVTNGVLVIGGNVRVEPTRARVREIVAGITGLVEVREEAVADLTLETSIALALDRNGFQRRAQVFPRSNLGRVTLYGSAASPQLAEDVARAVEHMPGVRQVENRISSAAA